MLVIVLDGYLIDYEQEHEHEHEKLNRDSIMPRRFHSYDERLSFWIYHRLARVGAGEVSHRIHRIESK
jgi:hypothetical protein